MTDLLVSIISMVSSKEWKTGFLFPWCFFVCFVLFGNGRGKVHPRVQVRDGKGKTNTLVMGIGKEE